MAAYADLSCSEYEPTAGSFCSPEQLRVSIESVRATGIDASNTMPYAIVSVRGIRSAVRICGRGGMATTLLPNGKEIYVHGQASDMSGLLLKRRGIRRVDVISLAEERPSRGQVTYASAAWSPRGSADGVVSNFSVAPSVSRRHRPTRDTSCCRRTWRASANRLDSYRPMR